MKLRITILVLLLVAIAALFSTQFQPQTNQSAQAGLSEPAPIEKSYKAWMVTEPLTKGQEVTRSQLKIVSLKSNDAFQHAIDHDIELSIVPHMIIDRDLAQDQFIFPEMLVTPDQESYVNLIIKPGHIPYPLALPTEVLVGGGFEANSFVDVLAYTASNNSHITDEVEKVEYLSERDTRNVSISPLLMHIKLLNVVHPRQATDDDSEETKAKLRNQKVTIVLELTQKQVAKMTVARHISDLAVQHSMGKVDKNNLTANVDDVLPNLNQVREMRGEQQ